MVIFHSYVSHYERVIDVWSPWNIRPIPAAPQSRQSRHRTHQVCGSDGVPWQLGGWGSTPQLPQFGLVFLVAQTQMSHESHVFWMCLMVVFSLSWRLSTQICQYLVGFYLKGCQFLPYPPWGLQDSRSFHSIKLAKDANWFLAFENVCFDHEAYTVNPDFGSNDISLAVMEILGLQMCLFKTRENHILCAILNIQRDRLIDIICIYIYIYTYI